MAEVLGSYRTLTKASNVARHYAWNRLDV